MTKGLQSTARRICSPKANKFHTCRLRSIFAQTGQHSSDVPVDADGLLLNLPGGGGLAQVQAGIHRPGVGGGHPPEGILDDHRGVVPHPQLQKKELLPLTGAEKAFIPLRRPVPALILREAVVTAEVHGHGPAAVGAPGRQVGGHPHIPLALHHLPDRLPVVKGLLTAELRALERAVIPLGIEQPLLVNPRRLELVVHVGGDDEIVLVPHQLQQVIVHRLGRGGVAVEPDIAAPEGPALLLRGEGVEPAGIHIVKAVLLLKVGEVPFKPLPVIGEARRRGRAHSLRGGRAGPGAVPVGGWPAPRRGGV